MGFKNWFKTKPNWIKSGTFALLISVVSFVLFLSFELLEQYIPRSMGLLQGIFGLIGMPITIGGWMFIWGDNGPPAFLHPVLQLLLGWSFWFLVGALIGLIRNNK
ncbi:hypothetical protein M0R36_08975 [bacterium]|jgi:heme A synthase|nr:hypothetical protein [bacterium]